MAVIEAEHPGRAIAPDVLASLRGRAGVAVVEIAGRDSLAAALKATRDEGLSVLVPTAAHTGTEYGDFAAPQRTRDLLDEALPDTEVLPLVRLASPRLWAAMNGRFADVVRERFSVHSPCLACHLYLHLCRVPLSWELASPPVVAGERDTHDGRVKLSQTPEVIDASVDVMGYAGIRLAEPVRLVTDGERIAEIVGESWGSSGGQLSCVLSGNYLDLGGAPVRDAGALRDYVEGFLVPVGREIVDAWRHAGAARSRIDYEGLVRSVLARTGTDPWSGPVVEPEAGRR